MKRELKRNYLPSTYRQDVFMKIYNLRQKTMSVEEYTMEFDDLMLKSELEEPDEHSIARYLGGLNFKIASVVNLQTYYSLNDVMKLALKVERQIKVKSTMSRFGAKEGYSKGSNSKASIAPKNTPKLQTKFERKQPHTVSSGTQ